jgi:hypothetical protein
MSMNAFSSGASLIKSWVDGIGRVHRQDGPSTAVGWGVAAPVSYLTTSAGIDLFAPVAESIYEYDWDMLVILDACRVDLLEEVAEEYAFIKSIDTTYSLGADSTRWIRENFTRDAFREEVQQTCYITGNPHTKLVLSGNEFRHLDEVWTYAFDDEQGFMPPRSITERAVAASREHNYNRLVVHYMQPHFPSVPRLDLGSTMDPKTVGTEWYSVWKQLKNEAIDRDVIWNAYRENLRYVLDEVAVLLENVDADTTIISADHGNAVGELGFYGHKDIPVRAVRRVPWCRTTGRDRGTLQPDLEPLEEANTSDLDEQLAALGYK